MLTSVVLARALGPEGRGAYAVAFRAIAILIAVSQFGLPEAMLPQMRVDRRRPSELAANSLVLALVATAVAAALLWATFPLLGDSFYKGVGRPLMWVAFLILPSNLLFLFFGRLIHLDGRLGMFNLLTLASRAATLIGVIVFLVVRPGEPSSAILGSVAASALVAIPSVVLVRRLVARLNWRVDLGLFVTCLRNGFKVQWGMFAHLVGQFSGVFILNYFLDLEDVGRFAIALGMATLILIFSEAARTVLQAWMPAAAANRKQVTQRTVAFARHTAIVLSAVTLSLVALGYPLIRLLYGPEFEAAYVPMAILSAGMVARGVAQILSSQLALEGYLALPSWAAVLGLIVSVSMSWFLVPEVGVWGAALGTAAGSVAALMFTMYWFLFKVGAELKDFLPRASDTQPYVRYFRLQLWRAS